MLLIRFLYIGSYVAPASFRFRVTTTCLRFAITSPLITCSLECSMLGESGSRSVEELVPSLHEVAGCRFFLSAVT